jgi:pimeloyl-ACP methyl ester carboxylesterase
VADQLGVDVGGVRLAYRVLGAPAALPMVLSHRPGSGDVSWAGVAEALAAGHRGYVPDLCGHGCQ